MKVTLKQIRAKKPCEDGWQKLLASLDKTKADNTEVAIGYIAKSNSVSDALWVLFNVLEGYQKEKAYLMHDIAARVLPIYEKKYPNDRRVADCVKAVKDFADGKITGEELDAARVAAEAARAARAAAWAAEAAWDAARVAAGAAWAAAWAAEAAWVAGAAEAARAAWDAARAAAGAAWAARAAWDAARAAERQAQIELIVKYFGE